MSFSPTSAFIATFFRVPHISDIDLGLNTFQIILATDRTVSYVVLNYGDIERENGEAGLNAGDGLQSEHVNTTGGVVLSTASNINRSGVFLFRVDSSLILGWYGVDTPTY